MDRSLISEKNYSRVPAVPERGAAIVEQGPVAPDVSPATADQSTVELVKSVLVDARDLITKEIESARLELRDSARQFKRATMSMAAAGFVLLLASVTLCMSLGYGLAALDAFSAWEGFLIVSGVLAVIGLGAFAVGRKRSQEVTAGPARTAGEIKQDIEWITREASGARAS